MRAGCRCENLVFVFFVCWSRSESGAPCVRGVHSSNKHCVAIYCPLSTWFSAFFTGDCSFRCTTEFSYSSLGGATIFAKLRSKIAKSPKIGGKVCAHHFVQIAEGFEKNSTAVVQGEYVDVHLYKFFFHTLLPSDDSMCQNSYRQCKNGAELTSLCTPKVIQEVNFQKSFLSSCIQDGLQLCTYVLVFLCGVRWRHNRAPNLEPRFLVSFVPV